MQSDDEETTNPAIVSWKMNMIRVDMNRQILRHSTKQIMIVLVFWAMMFAANATVYAQVEGNDPQSKVRLFYEAIGKGDCETALIIRSLDYSKKRCQYVTGVSGLQTAIAKETPAMMYLKLDVIIEKSSDIEKFSGFVAFRKENGRWQWVPGSVKSMKALDDYVVAVERLLSPKETVPQAERPASSADDFPSIASPADLSAETPTDGTDIIDVSANTDKEVDKSQTQRPPPAVEDAPRCWTNQDLRFVAGEEVIKKVPVKDENKRSTYPAPPPKLKKIPESYHRSVRSVDTRGEKLVALTFDLCEQLNERTGYDGRIIDLLRQEGVEATLYLGGKWMMDHPRRAKQLIADPLFELGNHAWTHGNMRVLRGEEMTEQVQETLKQFYGLKNDLKEEAKHCPAEQASIIAGKFMRTFRFPYGTCSAESLRYLNKNNMSAIQWDVVSGDPLRKQSAAAIEKIVLDRVKPGSIVVMHANGRGWNTADALKGIIPKLRSRGYRFVTVSELLASGEPIAADECYEMKPGDNTGYDKKFGKGTGE